MTLNQIGGALGNSLAKIGNYTSAAAAKANGISAASQAAQGTFNQTSANIANDLGTSRLLDQYAYNSASAAEANNFTQMMWDKAAAWNEQMLQKQMDFNAEQAQINRDFQKNMDSTKYQRAIKDMKTAGLNPILAVTGGGISASGASGGQASVNAPSMGSAQGAMASGGLLNGVSASEGNYQGQMEYMSGMLGLISAVLGGFSSAFGSLGSLGDLGEALGSALMGAFVDENKKDSNNKTIWDYGKEAGNYIREHSSDYKTAWIRRNQEKWGYNNHTGSGHSR